MGDRRGIVSRPLGAAITNRDSHDRVFSAWVADADRIGRFIGTAISRGFIQACGAANAHHWCVITHRRISRINRRDAISGAIVIDGGIDAVLIRVNGGIARRDA